MKKNITILILCLLIAVLCVRGQRGGVVGNDPYSQEHSDIMKELQQIIDRRPIETDTNIKFYKDFTSGLYYRDSAGIVRKANTLELSDLWKENHNQKWADSVLLASPPDWVDTLFCDRIYFDKQTWTATNNKVSPVPLVLKVVKWIRPVKYPDETKWFDNTGTYYNVIWARLKTSLMWVPLKFYRQ